MADRMRVTSEGMQESIPPADGHRNPRAVREGQTWITSIVVEDRAEAAVPGEQRIAAEPEQIQVERLVGLLLAVAVDHDGDGLRRLAGGKGERAGPGNVVAVAGLGSAV